MSRFYEKCNHCANHYIDGEIFLTCYVCLEGEIDNYKKGIPKRYKTQAYCEWVKDIYGRVHTQCSHLTEEDIEAKYCKYCGKEIRQVNI